MEIQRKFAGAIINQLLLGCEFKKCWSEVNFEKADTMYTAARIRTMT